MCAHSLFFEHAKYIQQFRHPSFSGTIQMKFLLEMGEKKGERNCSWYGWLWRNISVGLKSRSCYFIVSDNHVQCMHCVHTITIIIICQLNAESWCFFASKIEWRFFFWFLYCLLSFQLSLLFLNMQTVNEARQSSSKTIQ